MKLLIAIPTGAFLPLESPYAGWTRKPAHALDIPANWATAWNGEWDIGTDDVLTRGQALKYAADKNRDGMANCSEDWWLVFQVGEICGSSFLLLEHGAEADFSIKSSLALVWPTTEEIEQFGKPVVRAAKRKARSK